MGGFECAKLRWSLSLVVKNAQKLSIAYNIWKLEIAEESEDYSGTISWMKMKSGDGSKMDGHFNHIYGVYLHL